MVGTTTQTVGIISGDTVSSSPVTTYSGNTTVGDGTNAANLTATQILQNTLTINAGSTVTIAPSGSGIPSEIERRRQPRARRPPAPRLRQPTAIPAAIPSRPSKPRSPRARSAA